MARLLLDTHTLLWFLWGDRRLSSVARQAVADPSNVVFVSAASCWELAIKCGSGKMSLGEPVESFFQRHLAANNFSFLPVLLRHAARVETLPPIHNDPFDRMFVAQAMVEGLEIVTADPEISAYAVTCVW